MMLKKLFAALSIAAMVAMPAANKAAAPAHPEENFYALTAVIVGLDAETDTVAVKDSNGFSWEFGGTEDYCIGDVVSMVMNDNGTDIIFDDTIISARYSGYEAANLK